MRTDRTAPPGTPLNSLRARDRDPRAPLGRHPGDKADAALSIRFGALGAHGPLGTR
ncbi:hypothetical protein [Streptomyces sp. NK15101]|uniref:hypothetical protein n=1 Tax=Streptomyces sp. NK15101 TaxID=2873261 RepID=UPI001CEC12DA|nr:hypothetical protein [Streptomyces sp. NK15101]